jgi:hypothetical protein
MDPDPGLKGDLSLKVRDDERLRRRATQLIAAARRHVNIARGRLKAARRGVLVAQQHLERSRNAVQAAWLLRDLRRRLRPKR